jgi:DNA repair exonuclease SbcCD ATPase subunit
MVPRAGNVTIAASVEVSDNRDKEAADNGAAEAGDGQINRSCKLSIADTDERDHYPLFELLELLEGASGKDEPWLLVLARLIQENRLSDISKVARQIESIESQNSDLKSRLQHFEDWISELTKTKDWLQEHWSNWMRVAEEQKKRIEELEQQLKTKERTVEDPPDKTNK